MENVKVSIHYLIYYSTNPILQSDAHLVSTLLRANKKATPANKLASLYLLDAVCREARSRAKKAGKEKKSEVDPIQGVEASGTFASLLTKVEVILIKVVVECWENGLPEQRVSSMILPSH